MEGDRGIRVERDAIGSVLITGDVKVTVQFGLTFAPASFRGLVQRFLSYYLGSESRPVPFGGRTAQLEQLDAWLANPDATPNLLITAPAGRGKTALLVRWLQTVDAAMWPVAFVPISIRFGTNRADIFYQALAARLAEVLGDGKIEEASGDPAAVYKDKVIEQLDALVAAGKRCLLVIDGLDEAKGWHVDTSVLPEPIPALRIIVSARLVAGDSGPQNWLVRLGWRAGETRVFEVLPLDSAGIADVLHEMGVPLADLAGDVDLLSELERLTEGDPLLLRFYVEDLWDNRDQAGGLRPEDLRGREKGFAAYFKDWLDKQGGIYATQGAAFDEQTIKAILVVLACALGPLRLSDLVHLVHQILGSERIISRDSLEPIQRFLIGGSDEGSYALGHPKLAEYLREDFFGGSEDVTRAREALLAWGGDTVRRLDAEKLEPEKTPPYLLQFHAQHLEEGQASVEDFTALLQNGWRRAWEANQGSFLGFTNDVRTAWGAVKRALLFDGHAAVARHLEAGIRCALCMSSVWSLGVAIPPPLLEACLKHKVLRSRQALHFAELQDNARGRAEAFAAVVAFLEEPDRTHAMIESLDATRKISLAGQKVEVLAKLAPQLGPELLVSAVQVAEDIGDKAACAEALALLALHFSDEDAKIEYFNRATIIADTVENSYTKSLLFVGLAMHRPDVQDGLATADDLFARARLAAEDVTAELPRVEVLVQLAWCTSLDRDRELARQAIAAARGATSPRTRACALARLSDLGPEEEQRSLLKEQAAASAEEAVAAARELPREWDRVGALAAVAWILDDDRRLEVLHEALALARQCPGVTRATRLSDLFTLFPEEERTNLFQEILELKPGPYILGKLAPFLGANCLQQALRTAMVISDEEPRVLMLSRLLYELPPGERRDWVNYAVAVADQLKARELLGPRLKLAPFLDAERLAELVESASKLENWARVNALRSLSPYLSLSQFRQAVTAVREVTNALARASGLLGLAHCAREGERDHLLDETFDCATESQEPARTEVFVELAQLYPANKRLRRARSLRQALQSAWETKDGASRVLNVCMVAPLIPERRRRANLTRLVAEAMPTGSDLDMVMRDLFSLLAKEMPDTAVAEARKLRPAGYPARALAFIATELEPERRGELIREAYADAMTISDRDYRARCLNGLAGNLPEDLLPKVLVLLQEVPEPGQRAVHLAKFADQTKQPHRTAAIEGALKAAAEVRDPGTRASYLISFLHLLGSTDLLRALAEITEAWFRVKRPMLLQQLETMTPLLSDLGGAAIVRGMLCAVRDTAKWWP